MVYRKIKCFFFLKTNVLKLVAFNEIILRLNLDKFSCAFKVVDFELTLVAVITQLNCFCYLLQSSEHFLIFELQDFSKLCDLNLVSIFQIKCHRALFISKRYVSYLFTLS